MFHKSLIIRCEELAADLSVSRSTLWRMRQNGEIPSPINIGSRAIGWERAVIEDWLKSKRVQGE